MHYEIINAGKSRSFPEAHPFLHQASRNGDGVVYLGPEAGRAYRAGQNHAKRAFVAIELGAECLGVHTGEAQGNEGSNVVGFARFRLGGAGPSDLVELVRQPATSAAALVASRRVFEAAGLHVAVCYDFPGRIVDRLIRPFFNSALRRLDERLAKASDLDKTLCLGLGYPEGPIALLERTGLSHHFWVTQSLYEALGQEAYLPARRARVAAERASQDDDKSLLGRDLDLSIAWR